MVSIVKKINKVISIPYGAIKRVTPEASSNAVPDFNSLWCD